MFLPEEMTQVALVVPESDIFKVTGLLAEEGVFHHEDASYLRSEEDRAATDNWQRDSMACSAIEQRILTVMHALGIEEGQPEPALKEMPVVDIETACAKTDSLENEIQRLTKSLELDREELGYFRKPTDPTEAVCSLGIDISDALNLQRQIGLLGVMPSYNVDRLRTSLQNVPFVLQVLGTADKNSIVLLFGQQEDADVLKRAARSAYLNPLRGAEDYKEIPAEIASALEACIERTQQRAEERRAEIETLYQKEASQLRSLLWSVRMRRSVSETILQYGRRGSSYIVMGWLPTDRVAEMTERIRQASDKVSIVTDVSERASQDMRIPTELKHSKLLRPFQTLVTNYGRPRYGEIDPTFLVGVTFPLVFGIMFGDLGQGLLLALVGALLIVQSARKGTVSSGPLLLFCGIAAAIFGLAYGSVFGMEDVLPAIWLQPLHNIAQILVFSVACGAILLNVGLVVNLINSWLAHDLAHLFFGNKGVAGMLLYWSLIGLVAKVLAPSLPLPIGPASLVLLVGASGCLIIFGEVIWNLVTRHRPLVEGPLSLHLIKMGLELFETLLSFFSNTVSYVRMGAFAVAHGGLSAVIFILAEMASPTRGLGYWLVAVLGNLIIVGFEGLIVGIQTLRLEYYEFFSKFFKGGGKPYKPLRLFPQPEE